MEQVRETRYTMDVMERAARVLDATKDRLSAQYAGEDATGIGTRVIETLGWAPFALEQFAESMTEQLCELFNLDAGGRTVEAIKLAILDGCMLGALVEQAAYEKGFGL